VRVKVKLFANFRDGRFVVEDQEHLPGTRIADIIQKLGIQQEEVGIILLEGRHAEPEQELTDGSSLAIFPLVGGG
jgi:molybdopterin converting factor small subunit